MGIGLSYWVGFVGGGEGEIAFVGGRGYCLSGIGYVVFERSMKVLEKGITCLWNILLFEISFKLDKR